MPDLSRLLQCVVVVALCTLAARPALAQRASLRLQPDISLAATHFPAFQDTLERADEPSAVNPEHLSLYSLTTSPSHSISTATASRFPHIHMPHHKCNNFRNLSIDPMIPSHNPIKTTPLFGISATHRPGNGPNRTRTRTLISLLPTTPHSARSPQEIRQS